MREPSTLQKFADALAAGAPDDALAAMFPQLAAESSLTEAIRLLKQTSPEKTTLLRCVSESAAKSRQARLAGWQHDARKLRLRLRYQRRDAAAAMLPTEFLQTLSNTFRDGGFEVALGLEKRPRPLIHLGHPLPLGTEGLQECLDLVLAKPPADPDPVAALNRVAREGLQFLTCEVLPDYATPVLDLCRRAEWRWLCPEALRTEAMERVRSFLSSESFCIEKTGKEGGQKQVKRVEVRGRVQSMAWDGAALHFETLLDPGNALHPAKLLGGILGVDPAGIRGLVRTRLDLAADPRLDQAERFEPKLKNMFEDAVLLKAGSNLKIIEDDDDEPLRLG